MTICFKFHLGLYLIISILSNPIIAQVEYDVTEITKNLAKSQDSMMKIQSLKVNQIPDEIGWQIIDSIVNESRKDDCKCFSQEYTSGKYSTGFVSELGYKHILAGLCKDIIYNKFDFFLMNPSGVRPNDIDSYPFSWIFERHKDAKVIFADDVFEGRYLNTCKSLIGKSELNIRRYYQLILPDSRSEKYWGGSFNFKAMTCTELNLIFLMKAYW